MLEEEIDDVDAAGGGGEMQRRHAGIAGARADIRARGDERLRDGRAPRLRREMQRRVLADARYGADARAGVDEHARQLGVATLGGPVQGGHAVALRRAHVRALLEQVAQRVAIAFHRQVGGGRARCGGTEQR